MRVEPLALRQPLTETCAVAARAADSCSEAYTPTPPLIQNMREELRVRMPDLANAPLLEARVCQYEDTPDKNLLIDRHPEAENVWFVGGGSGHGFK
jgi:glycine/D-amino acid oxidase-like deaminating enzyme